MKKTILLGDVAAVPLRGAPPERSREGKGCKERERSEKGKGVGYGVNVGSDTVGVVLYRCKSGSFLE